MGAQLEPFGAGETGKRTIELAFELRGEVHVGHRTTLATRQMVMVADEGFGQLEAGEFPDAGHAMDDALGLEDGEIAIHAARALPGSPHHDLVDGERTPGGRKRFDQIAPRARVAAVAVGETRRDGFVKLGSHDRSIPMLSVIPVLDMLERPTIPCGV